MTISVYACITTRDGCIRNDVMGCYVNAVNHAQAAGVPIGGGRQQFNHGTAICRNKAVADFLAHTAASHLLFVDDDVLLPFDTITHLVESAARPGRDVVCGAYPTYKFVGSGAAYLYLTARPVGDDWLDDWPAGEVEIDAGGTGCMLIARRVFEAIGHPWFRWPEQHDPATGTIQWVSDDVDFCATARHKGFRVWCDGRVRPGHLKLTDLKVLLNGALRWKGGPPPDPADGYASHLPVLVEAGRRLRVTTAVEYGAGRFSTATFLDRAKFPHLERLVSFEGDAGWREDVLRRHGADPRLDLRGCPVAAMPSADAPPADVVFVDCDTVERGNHDFTPRVHLIQRYATDPAAVVIVHDANFAAIRPAVLAAPYQHKVTFVPPHGPHTALLSNAHDVARWF